VQALVAERAGSGRRRFGLGAAVRSFGPAPRLAAAGALTAAAVAIAVALSGGAAPALSERQTAALTLRPATERAPAESPTNRMELVAAVDGVSFPYWEEHFGWRSTGQRTDRVQGHDVMTVFYANRSGQRIGYAIVAGTAPRVSGGSVSWLHGNPYRVFALQGARTVAWMRQGRLCVLSGRGVDAATLLRLASWGKRGSAA
jgi:hypothetical protein